ncbi:PspC domain-containing protein [Nocardioides speluncae]|uniref:PspC domain-containing protein n=1 Tax=Nocardioides speluncae TaxID=2670337 RepID=UPI000D69DA37|nr:PspC domain-containing protein [Nocardioides speluncae]
MSYASTPQPAAGPKRLARRSDNAMIGGVCSGVANYLGVDVTLVRVLTVLGVVFGLGSVLVAYVIAWILLPQN